MLVRLGCWLVLLAVVCGALADLEVSKDYAEEIESDNNTFVANVSFQPKQCQLDADCHNEGKCKAKEDFTKYCDCKNGTSGDFCELVDECVNGSVDCGVHKNASCVFDVKLEQAICECDNKSKVYVPDDGCESPCGYIGDVYVGCGKHGACRRRIGKRRLCQCNDGAAGDFCDIIKECQNKVVDCGTDPLAVCNLSDGHAYCECSNPKHGFDYEHKICKDCKCGPDGIGCTFRNGTKICSCFQGSKQNGDLCEKCDCDSEAYECDFKEGKKVCTCKDGYIPVGPDKICMQMCNNTNPCQNGGTCSQKVCSCLKGTSGHLCKTLDDCKSRCGTADCFYNVTSRDIYCECYKGYAFDDYNKRCKACDCGIYQKSCSYVEGKKKCNCFDSAYAERLGKCTFCYCKGYASMNGCKFDDDGDKKCNCLRGYAQYDEECKRCDCGIHGNCTLSGWGGWSKSCQCEKGYSEDYGTCEKCDCGENGTCSFVSGKKACYCDSGFEDDEGTCKECDCGDFSNCEFDRYGNKKCTCMKGYALRSGVCTRCNCHPGTSCIFKNHLEKECICPHGYANFIGGCTECDCQMDDSNCTMDNGLKECQCPKGFESNKDFMNPSCIDTDKCLRPQDNDCPSSTKCVNTYGSYDCVCREGFEVYWKYMENNIKRDGCKDIDECLVYSACMDIHSLCINTPGSYRCECEAGYSLIKDRNKEQYNSCSKMGGFNGGDSRPWRTASIVVGVLFGIVIFVQLLLICSKHCDT